MFAKMQTSNCDSSLQAPLLDPFEAVAQQAFSLTISGAINWRDLSRRMTTDFFRQLALAGPIAINLIIANAVAVSNLYFVARGGTQQLAAAALGNNVSVMLGRLVLLGLCGALDTLAAQAWGAGKERRLPLLLQRTVLFLWLHCVVISGAMLLLPGGLQALGQDPGLSVMLRRYLLVLLPSVWLEALYRPITRVLVARGIVNPQMVISLIGLPLNVATNYVLVVVLGWEYLGAAVALSAAAGYDVVMLLVYVAVSGQWSDVVGAPTRKAFKGWRQLARLAYPAASMKCAESWAFTICTLAASLLPNACMATAAVGVSYNVYGVLFIAFVAFSTAACVTVGNRLGAGDPRGAKVAAAGSLLIVPPAWGLAALALLMPRCQTAIMGLFVTEGEGGAGAGGDSAAEALRAVLRQMFVIVAGLVLVDGIQTVLSGIIQGCGRQHAGAVVNLVAFYVFALPLALFLAFQLSLPAYLGGGVWGLGLGPRGLYLGMAAGPAIQTACYAFILLRTNWQGASQAAVSAAALNSTSSLASLIWKMDSGSLTGAALIRSAASSGQGMGSFIGGSPLRLPIIEEHWREGRDSSEFGPDGRVAYGGSRANTAISAPVSAPGSISASARIMNSWLQVNNGLLLEAFGGRRGGGGELGGEGSEEWLGKVGSSIATEGAGSGEAGGVRGDKEDGGGAIADDAIAFSSLSAAVTGDDDGQLQSRPRRSSSRLRVSSGGTAAAAAVMGACIGGDDKSPDTTARSQASVITNGSPPLAEPTLHYMLAATLKPSSPPGTAPYGRTPVGSSGACDSSFFPEGLREHVRPFGTSEPSPVPLLPSVKVAATANGGSLGAGCGPDGDTTTTAVFTAAAAAPVHWLFGWGWPPTASANGATDAANAMKDAPDLAAEAAAVSAAGSMPPLQLPGVCAAVCTTRVSAMDTTEGDGAGSHGTVATQGSGQARMATVVAAVAPLPIAPVLLRIDATGGCSSREEAIALPPDSAIPSGTTSGSSLGSMAARGPQTVGMAVRGEVFHSCESLVAAVPGSEDFYAFSSSTGTEGGSWLDPPASFESVVAGIQDQLLIRTSAVKACDAGGSGGSDGYGGGDSGGDSGGDNGGGPASAGDGWVAVCNPQRSQPCGRSSRLRLP